MVEKDTLPGWSSHGNALSVLAMVSVVLAALIVLPYLQYVLFAVVLAYVLAPVQRVLERRTSSTKAALLLIATSIFVILLPIAYVLTIALRQGLELLAVAQEGAFSLDRIEDRLETIGYVVDLDLLYATYQEPIATGLQGLATGALSIIGGLPGVLIGVTVTVFVLFTLLRDGDQLIAWLRSVLPIDDHVQRELLVELDHLMWASVVGNVAVAVVQAVLLGVGLAVIGVPGIVFLTVATFILTLLPLVGAFGVWVPVSFYLLALGRPVTAGILVVYGSIVSGSDMYLRPALIGRSGAINVAVIVVGIFGGLILFGAVGLFIGPVALGGAKVVLDLFAQSKEETATV
ncbi:AI-2E family transporter [Halosimplex aquaticum]|uniref:AI-2E family transporter n=1 Tax=Halosimplex aquaticum TaxID=3026162 RepID=A0ABD5Y3Y8_9EURY|nr:AI-2E family transporter [Halosimplex aquaticum]